MTLGPYHSSEIIRDPLLVTVIALCSFALVLISRLAMNSQPGHYCRAAIVPQTLACLVCLVLWFFFSGSDAFVPIIFACPAFGPIGASTWSWFMQLLSNRKARALESAAAAVVEQVEMMENGGADVPRSASVVSLERRPSQTEIETIADPLLGRSVEDTAETVQDPLLPPNPVIPTVFIPRLCETRSFVLEDDDLESGYATPRDYRVRFYPQAMLPIEMRTLAATSGA
ncbi:hypothetical protein FOL47_003348 [Perkinsus chesapeaki]|uniref:Uncharacterized protein n=1 Tax=Perkinsus chesapeaki TaxID=330153 RepID=A0A7J6M8L0_PERCH|nr:hypothetical protein FOL47_003348 [Perkinsus chesapeaki]